MENKQENSASPEIAVMPASGKQVLDIYKLMNEIKLETKDIELPGLSGVLRIKQLTSKEADEARAALLKDGLKPTGGSYAEYRKHLIAFSLVDNDDKKLCENAGAADKILERLSDKTTHELIDIIEKHNFTQPENLAAEKKS